MRKRTRYTHCLYCDEPLSAKQKQARKQYCCVEHAYAHRPVIHEQNKQAQERAAQEDAQNLAKWMSRRHERKAARARRKAMRRVLEGAL